MTDTKCYACGKRFRSAARWTVKTSDGQWQSLGPDCFKHVEAAGDKGYQPPLGGPRLFIIPREEYK